MIAAVKKVLENWIAARHESFWCLFCPSYTITSSHHSFYSMVKNKPGLKELISFSQTSPLGTLSMVPVSFENNKFDLTADISRTDGACWSHLCRLQMSFYPLLNYKDSWKSTRILIYGLDLFLITIESAFYKLNLVLLENAERNEVFLEWDWSV